MLRRSYRDTVWIDFAAACGYLSKERQGVLRWAMGECRWHNRSSRKVFSLAIACSCRLPASCSCLLPPALRLLESVSFFLMDSLSLIMASGSVNLRFVFPGLSASFASTVGIFSASSQ